MELAEPELLIPAAVAAVGVVVVPEQVEQAALE
jgi:hypothetical protein